jgi:hypothetical protein
MKFIVEKNILLSILFILICLEVPIIYFTVINNNRLQLSVLIGILILISGYSVMIQRFFQLEKFSFNYDFGTFLYFQSIYMITFLIIYRLIYAPFHFEGNVIDINFGYKNTKLDESIAFSKDLNSIGHCVWGFCIIFIFPWFTEHKIWHLIIKETLSTAVIIYPIYNLIKRSIKSIDTFSSSSYFNNNAEWTYGAILGILVGFVIMIKQKMDSNYHISKWVSIIRITTGLILMTSVIIRYILTITSWNETYTKNSNETGIIILISLLGIQMIIISYYISKRQTSKICEMNTYLKE